MSTDINKVIIIGRLTKDPELKAIQSGKQLAFFSIACNRTYLSNGDKVESVSFFNCIAWEKLGEIIVEYARKGSRLGIEGRLQQRSWENRDGFKQYAVEIIVESIQFLEQLKSENSSMQNNIKRTDLNQLKINSSEKFDDSFPISFKEEGLPF